MMNKYRKHWLYEMFYCAIYKCPKCGHRLEERDIARICMNCGYNAYDKEGKEKGGKER